MLGDYGIEYVCETENMTFKISRYYNGITPVGIIIGKTPDVSEYLDFGLYDWVADQNNAGIGLPKVGRWLAVSHRVGQLMPYWILAKSGIPIYCTKVQRITNLERKTDKYKEMMKDFG